jgi:peroxiredoxin
MALRELKMGNKAPLFKLKSFNEGIVDLKEYYKKQNVILIFSRYFGCPICQLDLNNLLKRQSEIEKKGVKILYITQSGDKVANEFVKQKNISFPVISSNKDELYKEYGLGMMTADAAKEVKAKFKEAIKAGIQHGEYEGWEQQGPGQFVIDTSGNLIHAKKGWLEVDKILEVL